MGSLRLSPALDPKDFPIFDVPFQVDWLSFSTPEPSDCGLSVLAEDILKTVLLQHIQKPVKGELY